MPTRSKMYDALWEVGNEIFKHSNPCDWKDGQCVKDRKYKTVGRCCAECKYITKEGCSTKALGCKLHMCYEVGEKYKDVQLALSALRAIAYKCNIPLPIRASKTYTLKILKCGW